MTLLSIHFFRVICVIEIIILHTAGAGYIFEIQFADSSGILNFVASKYLKD